MAREDQPASNSTARPIVPGPRRHATRQAETVRDDTGQADGTEAPSPVRASAERVLEHTRLSGIWVAAGCFLVVLVFLLVFILENDTRVNVSFFGAHVTLYLGVALVLAAVCGALLVMFAGMARIMQLRSRARKHRRAARKAANG
jgi:uncharacterized integral membrane protein